MVQARPFPRLQIRFLWASIFAVCTASASIAAFAQDTAPIMYRVTFENAVHHEARISVTYRDIGEAPLVLRMSRSSPGRYALHEFAKNVYAVEAVDGAGDALDISRIDPHAWRVTGHDGAVTVSYTLYADRADGTYSQIDLTHAHLNMPATFMWAEGFDERPINVKFDAPNRRWKVATQLAPARGRMTFSAPNLQYFMDSPTEISDFEVREWRIGDGESQQTIRLAVHHDGEEEDVDIFAAKIKKIVSEEIKIFGEPPRFDYGVYTFIADYLPHVSGDGMEHRNSTILTSARSLYENEFSQIGTAAHEFFHAWNSERMRAAELEPFDFRSANPTPSLWFAEGFTSYYGPLAMRCAEETSVDDYLSGLGRTISYIINSPGRRLSSPREMSLRAALVDGSSPIDPTNNANTFVSYYPYGATIALALDLTLRERFEGVTLDDYMRRMWNSHSETDRPYTPDDLREALAETTGDAAFAEDFFKRYIEAGGLPDFEALLARAGLALVEKDENSASAGPVSFDEDGDTSVVVSTPIIGSALYKSGLERGDEIQKLGRFRIDDERDWDKALRRFNPGDKTTIKFVGRAGAREATIVLAKDNALEIKPYENIDRDLTDKQKAFRKAWLGLDAVNEDM